MPAVDLAYYGFLIGSEIFGLIACIAIARANSKEIKLALGTFTFLYTALLLTGVVGLVWLPILTGIIYAVMILR